MPPTAVVSFDRYIKLLQPKSIHRYFEGYFLSLLSTSQERVEKELELVRKEFYSFYLVCVGLVNDNMYHWRTTIRGPPDTPYERGLFVLNIHFGGSYPLAPPMVCFQTKNFHPNISRGGAICSEKLLMSGHWHRQTRMTQVLRSIYQLLIEPDIKSATDPWFGKGFPGQRAVADMYVHQRGLYENEARICTTNYATWG